MRNKNKLSYYYFILKSVIWLFSIFASLLISIYLFIITVNTVGYIYELKHSIPSGEDDLGAGIVMLIYASIAFLSAIPLSYFLIIFFKKKLSKLLGVTNE